MDRKRRLMENNNGWPLRSQLFDGAPFRLPLLSTAVPASAAPGTTATFTRATTKTWQNNDGYLVTGLAGEIGFPGARRVRNWIVAPTENWASAGWVKTGISVSGNRLTATGANGIIYDNAALSMGIGRTAVGSVTLSRVTGTGNIDVSTNGGTTWTTVSVTGARVSVSLTGNINGQFAIRIVTSGDAVEATYPQLEDVTAQTTQTAGEYVSVGVESAPYYHGSFVDGVKCFPTDLSGNAIPSTTLLGYSAEGARTNLCLQSQTLGTTWGVDSSTVVTGDQYTAPDGTMTMDKITSIAVTSQHYLRQGITFSAGVTTYSCYLRYINNQWAALIMSNGGGLLAASFDLLNGVVGALGAGTTSTIEPTSIADVYRVSITGTMSAGAGNVFISPNATDYAGNENYTAAGTETVGAWGAQLELGSFASSYIPTTTIAATRNADVLMYSSAGNIDGTKGWVYCEAITNTTANHAFVGFDSTNQLMSQSNQKVSMYDGANQAVSTSAITLGTQFKGAVTWGSAGVKATINGEAPGSNASFDGDAVDGKANIYIGEWNGGSGNNFGNIGPIYIGQRQLSSSELQAITR